MVASEIRNDDTLTRVVRRALAADQVADSEEASQGKTHCFLEVLLAKVPEKHERNRLEEPNDRTKVAR